MKKQFIICLLVLYSLSSFAQDKAMLTKEETVNYLSKKAKEVISLKRTLSSGGFVTFILENSVYTSGENVVISFKRSNYLNEPGNSCEFYRNEIKSNFNPAHILEITDMGSNSGEVTGLVKIKLISKTGKVDLQNVNKQPNGYPQASALFCDCCKIYYHPLIVTSEEYVYLNYLNSDPSNFNKIKKALEHLRDLCKAEDDPFGE